MLGTIRACSSTFRWCVDAVQDRHGARQKSTMDERFITPQKVVSGRFEGQADIPEWDIAVLCFRGPRGSSALVEAVGARPIGRKLLWGMEEAADFHSVYEYQTDGKHVGIVTRCLWGGPQAAILVEELSHIGVGCIIGYGCAGTIDPELPRGAQFVISTALLTDGTSRHYADEETRGSAELLGLVKCARQVTAGTVDAVYRETPALLREWRNAGVQVINMEAAPFYAASARCGVESLYLGHVSDVVIGEWRDWYGGRDEMNVGTIRNSVALIESIPLRRSLKMGPGRAALG